MEFKNLRQAETNRLKERLKQTIDSLKTEEDLKRVCSFEGKTYKGTFEEQKSKLIRFLKNRNESQIKTALNKISSVENAEDFKGNYIINVTWLKNRMWGYNPKGEDNNGNTTESISGCGYDKLSTATAQLLNQNQSILKLLYAKKEKAISDGDLRPNRDLLGYGSGYKILPHFEGGVGWECHRNVLKSVGVDMSQIADTKTTNTFLIMRD